MAKLSNRITSVSNNCRRVLTQVEAIVLVHYKDGVHNSIGTGYNDVKNEYAGKKITVPEAFKLQKVAIAEREALLAKWLSDNHGDYNQFEYDALFLCMYQSGNRYVPAMDALMKYPGGKEVVAEMFPLCAYNNAGEYIPGLKIRREREQAIFKFGDYGPVDAPAKLYHVNPHLNPKAWVPYHITDEDLA